ncbi:hypothetical protein F5J12DRAFT_783565 [Pisolithus orientalis]|uniref:uncharacterized protein n=1 Tax=Pisolithus orientalis TaxID=936130 RepID=UPI002224ED79|nr:uncharacterized protein F5J12DRAFT_783565 [Pisolithus orientalis]KAI6003500.1 hypothetical protein F5J12DRAFT_783565 [Pisolithus orientalis]
MPGTRSSAVTVKVGPPVGAQRSKRVNPTVTLPTKAQPSHGTKAHHQVVKLQGGNQDMISETHEPMSGDGEECLNHKSSSVARHPPLQLHSSHNSSEGLTEKECEDQYLDSFQMRQVTLQNDIVAEQGHKKSVAPNDSEEDEQAVESTVQAEGDLVSENLVDHDGCQAVENMMDSIHHDDVEHESASDSDWSADQRHDLKNRQTLREICVGNYDTDNHPSTPPLPSPSSSEEEDGAANTKGDTDSSVTRRHREAKGKSHALANTSSEDEDGPSDTGDLPDCLEMTRMHRKPKGQHHAFCKVVVTPSVPTLASDLSQYKDASSAEAGLPHFKPGQLPLEAIQRAQALGMCTTQEAQVIADEYGKTLGSIMAATGLTTKATHAESVWNMHQAWYAHTNPKASAEETKDYYRHHTKHYEDHKDEDEHPQLWAEIQKYWSECVSGSKDISSKAMAQTWCNVEGIHVFGCVIYSGSDEAAHQSQGIFAGSSLLMQLASERQTDITQLLEYLSTIIKYKILNSAASVPLPDFNVLSQPCYDCALGLKPQEYRCDCNHAATEENDFNVKCLNADELCALTVPFLKESMGADYHAEAPLDDEEDQAEYLVPLLNSSFYLKKWTDVMQGCVTSCLW